MPYITQKEREFIRDDRNLNLILVWLRTLPVEQRKGFVAYIVNLLAKHSFTHNYFGLSTGIDAVRSAYREMVKELDEYEAEKKKLNGT